MNKKINTRYGYLIGKYQGEMLWLNPASWKCDWYWGFGHVGNANSHMHWEGLLGETNGGYNYHINEVLEETVLSDSESWKLSDLMKTFYTLKESAEIFGRGCNNLTSQGEEITNIIKNDVMLKQINEVMLPALFKEMYKILTPAE